jgi:hypothetical protein
MSSGPGELISGSRRTLRISARRSEERRNKSSVSTNLSLRSATSSSTRWNRLAQPGEFGFVRGPAFGAKGDELSLGVVAVHAV